MRLMNLKYVPVIPVLICLLFSCSQEKKSINYRSKDLSNINYDMVYAAGNWDHPDYGKAFESNGNHRIVVEVENPSEDMVQARIPWRRSDPDPHRKDVIIVDTKTGAPVENKLVMEINNEFGYLLFEPNDQSRLYYIYYLPHVSTGGYYPKLHYKVSPEQDRDQWLSQNGLIEDQLTDLPFAKISRAESLDDFHSFFPMEVAAHRDEVLKYVQTNPRAFYLFPEYRDRPIRMDRQIPQHWVSELTMVDGISDAVLKGEYYTFQIGIYSPNNELDGVEIEFSDLEGRGGQIPEDRFTCFNISGIDLNGVPFRKKLNVERGKIQALWFGLDVPGNTKAGEYMGRIVISAKGLLGDTTYLRLKVSSEKAVNRGDDDPSKMSRLRWLNSTIGAGKEFILDPFTPISFTNKKISILGRDVHLDESGLPAGINSFFTQEMTTLKQDPERILAAPIQFNIQEIDGGSIRWSSTDYAIQQEFGSELSWETINESENFTMKVIGRMEIDGMLSYEMRLIAKENVDVKDIGLVIPMEKDAARYMLGLGRKGGRMGQGIAWKWDIMKHHEGAWLGNVNKGLQFVLRDDKYERPLNTNFYQAKPLIMPVSWYNEGKGGINITPGEEVVNIESYSGVRKMVRGDTLNFHVRFLITPFKLINTNEHFSTRFVHKYVPIDTALKWNGTIINVHHANEINPYINYPFFNLEQQKAYIDEAHEKGVKVKLYNTIRELTYRAHELFAMRSLGDEIFNDGEGGGHSWLQEHLRTNYHSAWHAWRVNDAAILNKGTSRWTNYYVEGINWLAKNQDIDGLYLDDIAFSRTTVKRIANVLSKNRENYVIDLHSANQFNPRDGFINSAFLYMEHFPYVSRLWFGEYFEYDLGPDYWLTEVSGIPFGLTGEMLEKGGHPYRGLVFGMTKRVYGNHNPKEIWKLFDDFDIASSEMLGYWVDRSPIKTSSEKIRSTVYMKETEVLIAIGSWSDRDENVKLIIDWDRLGMNEADVSLASPEIQGLQEFGSYDIRQPVPVKKNQGLILILDSK